MNRHACSYLLLGLALVALSGCVTVPSSRPGTYTSNGDLWFVRQKYIPFPVPIILESTIFYCPSVATKHGRKIPACYEAKVPKRFR